jgi:hypothetical protein
MLQARQFNIHLILSINRSTTLHPIVCKHKRKYCFCPFIPLLCTHHFRLILVFIFTFRTNCHIIYSRRRHSKLHFYPGNNAYNSILFNERIMMAITREDDFEKRGAGEWRNLSERVIAIIRE